MKINKYQTFLALAFFCERVRGESGDLIDIKLSGALIPGD
jgi:hypothetical protein